MSDAQQDTKLSAVVIGYTGETGKALVSQLAGCEQFERVTLAGRRQVDLPPEAANSAKFQQVVIDFDKLDENPESHAELFANRDTVFCCLGTTRGKAGSDGFVKVDHDYIMAAAKAARAAHVKQFHLVSSSGANKSSMFLYPRIKGQVEENLANLGFPRLAIYRPKLLMCNREESRPGENALRLLFKPAQSLFPTMLTTPTTTLASAMVHAALINSGNKRDIYFNEEIFQLAARTDFHITK